MQVLVTGASGLLGGALVHALRAHGHGVRRLGRVGLPELGQSLTLKTGDRLDLPAATVHDAVVGSQGVVCLEAHKG